MAFAKAQLHCLLPRDSFWTLLLQNLTNHLRIDFYRSVSRLKMRRLLFAAEPYMPFTFPSGHFQCVPGRGWTCVLIFLVWSGKNSVVWQKRYGAKGGRRAKFTWYQTPSVIKERALLRVCESYKAIFSRFFSLRLSVCALFLPQSPHSVCVGVLFWGRRGGLSCFEVCQFAQEHSSLLFWHLDACSHFFPRKHLPWVGCLVFCLQWSIIIRCVSSVASVNLACSVCRATAPVPVSSAISEWSGRLATIARWRHNRVAQLQPFDSVMNTYWKYTKPPRSAPLLPGTRKLTGPFWEQDRWPARPDPAGLCGH